MYFGQVQVSDGKPVTPDKTGYWPRKHSNPWNTDQWPTHDYPMPLAEACLTLHALTGDVAFLDAVRRWARIAMDNRPGRTGTSAYAENYGRCIHFLTRAGVQLDDKRFLADASQLADEALACLCEDGMIKGFPDGHVYESVDGVGYLLVSLMFLEQRRALNLYGFGF